MKIFVTIVLFVSSSFADNYGKRLRPLYEFGAGITHARFPSYPGASSTKSITLPFPTALYRGDVLRLKREEGAREIFYRGERIELDISFDGTLPSDGEDTQIREGMNKLDALIEVGPRFLYNILKVSPTNPWDLDFHLAGRVAVSSGFLENVFLRGLVINPFLTVRRVSLFTDDDLFGAFAGVKFASKDWHSYYYEVKEKFVTSTRPFYEAKSGLSEYSFAAFYNYPIKNDVYIFAGLVHSIYSDSANRGSPLLTEDENTSVVFGAYWNFYKSEKMVLD